jgi:uncharacterized protein YutE (UPF0331/DUF86 family)
LVVRPEAIRARLLRLEEVTSGLEELRAHRRDEQPENFRDTWAVERGLQLAAEIVLDIGNHILSAHFGRSAQDYEDIIAQLGETGVLVPSTCERLKGLGGFRNILVHGYLRIDPNRVNAHLQDAPTNFSEFARDVTAWVDQTLKKG